MTRVSYDAPAQLAVVTFIDRAGQEQQHDLYWDGAWHCARGHEGAES